MPIQSHYGWRASFYVFGVVGLVWATTWYRWFRDTPAEKNQLTPLVHASESMESHATTKPFLWRDALRSPSVLALLFVAFSYVQNFYTTWLHTFLVKGRGFSEDSLWLSACPSPYRGVHQSHLRCGERRTRPKVRAQARAPNAGRAGVNSHGYS